MPAPGTEPPRAWRIGIYAPAGFATEPSAVERAVERLRAAGHRVTVDPTCGTRWQRFSAPDDERLAAVMRMAEDPDVELAIPVRGGYGWSRLLDRLDYAAIARSGTRWIGHSDFTAFQLAALAHAGLATYAGPMAAYDFGAATPSTFTHEHCWRLLGSGRDAVACTLGGPDVVAEGTLWGGNLALVAHLAGTAHLPQVDNGILFLEDIGEHPYRIERMLHQLRFAGILERQQAIVLGRFNGYEPTANDDGYDFAAMVEQLRAHCAVPILTGLPFGHCRDKLTLPVGGRCALTVRGGAAELVLTGSAVPMAAPGAAPGAASAVASAAGGAATGAPVAAQRRFAVCIADWPGDAPALRALRHQVFVVEQSVPEALEWDGQDAACRHALAVDADGHPIGCGRLLPDGHIGRMAVLPEWRGQGVGTALLDALVRLAREVGHRRVALNAQTQALAFYERCGFMACGAEYEEAGIAHRAMVCVLR
jgi:muramoyltetrapeptide carboxypeptidase